jgi:CBS domain containing-hemolysin-like protein
MAHQRNHTSTAEGFYTMVLLIVYLFTALFFSFLCSVLEAMLLSVTPSYAVALEQKGSKVGGRLGRLKQDIDRPLAAILSLNTIAHTVGAAGVGAQATKLFGDASVGVVSGILTLLILVFSEIIPKTLGALYWRQVAPLGTHILQWLMWGLYPLVILSQKITQMLARGRNASVVSRDEFHALADMGVKEGVFLEIESHILQNLMRFGSLSAKDIMTPRSVVFSLSEDTTVAELLDRQSPFSRIPLHPTDGESIQQYVLNSDILLAAARGQTKEKLIRFARSILVVPETLSLPRLFDCLLEQKQLIAAAVDEYGRTSGIVTMEDLLETIVGVEVVDETDETTDMQHFARQLWEKRAKALGLVPEPREKCSQGLDGEKRGDEV